MNFYNDDEKKAGAPVIPGAASPFKKTSAFGKSPMFSRAAGSIFDRLKNLSRKDMAFVGIGLSILVMAPVAEYMMNQPEAAPSMEGSGFGSRDGKAPLDTGFGSLSAGSSDGAGEVITPLSSRDPSSLILGAQPAQPPAAPYTPPPTSFRDSVKEVARESFSAATKSAGAPTPIPKMGSMLRGMSSFSDSGGSSTRGSLSGGKIMDTAQSAPNKAAKRSMVGPVAMAGYKGVASNTPNSASKGAFEKLRNQADKSAGYFSGGSAMNSLDKAAAEAVNVGAGGGGAGGLGDGEKTGKTGNSSVKGYDRNMNPKETLEEMAAKQRMQKALEWEFFKKYEIPKQIINAVVGEVAKWFGSQTARALNGPGAGPTSYVCIGKLNKDLPCEKTNFKEVLRNSDEKVVDSWKSNQNLCPCGVLPAEDFAASVGGGNTTGPGGGNTTTTTTGTGGGTGQAPAVSPVFKDFDTTLVDMLKNIQAGAKTTDAKELLRLSEGIAKGFGELHADKVVTEINNRTAQTSRDVAAYKEAVKKARGEFDEAWNQYKVFKVQLQAVNTAAGNGTLYVGSVNGISADATQAVKPDVEKALGTLIGYETSKIAVGDARLKFHEAAYPVYESQIAKSLALAGAVSQDYLGNVVGKANTIKGEIAACKGEGDAVKPDKINDLRAKFTELSGAETAVKEQPQTLPATRDDTGLRYVSLPPADLRTAVAGATRGGAGLIASPVKWRGLGSPEIQPAETLNDVDARAKEGTDWSATSPATKGSNAAAVVDLDNLAEASLLASSIRAIDEISNDAKNAKVDPGTAVSQFTPVKEEMDRIRKVLETWKIDIANPTHGAAGTTPTTTQTATGTGTGAGSGNQPVNVTVNVNTTANAGSTSGATNNTHTTAAAVATKPKPKPQGNTGTGGGLDTNKVNLYQRGMQTQNDAIKAARQAMNNAKARSDAAKAQFDAAYNTCNSTCSKWPAFTQDTCWAGCKVTTGFNGKSEAFTRANDEYRSAISFVSQKKSECAAYLSGTVEPKYRSIAGTCLN